MSAVMQAAPTAAPAAVLTVDRITKVFRVRRQEVRALDDVSFSIAPGATLGLVGESGSGKSTVARCALRLIEPTSGSSTVDGVSLEGLGARELRRLRASTGVVFQNPVAALDPRSSVVASIAEPLRTHTNLRGRALRIRISELLDEVGLASAQAGRLPHQLSGGQAQRVGIARALATTPKLLVLDEPTSALDVSVQAQVLNLLQRLRAEHDLAYLLISHDLDVVRHMSDEAAVMRSGRIVESGPATEVLVRPQHEYTQQLLASMPAAPVPAAVPAAAQPVDAHPADAHPADAHPADAHPSAERSTVA